MRELEDEERSHRGEAIGGAGDQCSEERKNQTEMKKICGVLYDTSDPKAMIDFCRIRGVFSPPGNFKNMLLI